MGEPTCGERYPSSTVALASIVSLATYAAGAFVIYQIGWVWLVFYLLYIIWLEINLLRKSCVNCCYYGKVCAFGKGKLAGWLFKQGDADSFGRREITWKDIVPDFLVSVIPVVAGIVLMAIDFRWPLLVAVLVLLLLVSMGNSLVRGKLACRYCRQRELGCPAERLFNRGKAKA